MRRGELLLLVGGEQRDLADLLEVHAHGVVSGEGVHEGVRVGYLLLGDLLYLLQLLKGGQDLVVHGREYVLAGGVYAQILQLVVELVQLLGFEVHVVEDVHELLGGELAGLLALFDEGVELFLLLLCKQLGVLGRLVLGGLGGALPAPVPDFGGLGGRGFLFHLRHGSSSVTLCLFHPVLKGQEVCPPPCQRHA